MGVKVQLVRCKVFENATGPGLEADINAWLAAAAERILIATHFMSTSGGGAADYSCLIFYTE